jgi:hypothetical protein
MNNLNIKELKNIVSYIIDNNNTLREQNKKTTAVEVIGESGIGKTSAIIQIAQERKMDFVKLNLGQLEELGDLIGFCIKEYYICSPDGKCIWVAESLLQNYIKLGYNIVENAKVRMSYAPPEWVPKNTNPNGVILCLDDWTRADGRMITALMEMIDRGEYISWSLPDNCTIILSANPDNGDYNVSSLDNAQKTRYISFELDFDKDAWAEWAEGEKINGVCINFALQYPEIFKKEGSVQTVNPRSLVTFFNTISGLKDFDSTDSLYKIMLIAKGCFTSKENIVGNLFTMFINNRLHQLIQPEDMLFDKWDTVSRKLDKCIYSGENSSYRADIGATLTTRFINYIQNYFDTDKDADTATVCNRILEIINYDKILLAEDLVFNLIRNLVGKYPTRTNKLLMNPKVMQKIIG